MCKKAAKKQQKSFIECYFFYPQLWHKLLAFILLPFACIYAIITLCKKYFTPYKYFDMKILSIGNLVSGGSGKTPFCIALVQYLQSQGYTNIYVILRGYKRKSKGCIQISKAGIILCNVAQSGDEAMLIATQTTSSVIVSENRVLALQHAKLQNADIVILDDAYRFNFNKFDILLEPKLTPYFPFVLPSGYYRFPKAFYKQCDLHLKEGKDYIRKVQLCHIHKEIDSTHIAHTYQTPTQNTQHVRYILATAIANPSRLQPFLPEHIVYTYYLPDHADFQYDILYALLQEYQATHILMTQKDYVKCTDFALPFALLTLTIEIDLHALQSIESFLQTQPLEKT